MFLFIPTENFVSDTASVDGGNITYVDYSFNATSSYDSTDNIDVFDVLGGLATFSINGIPFWLSILAVYIPVFLLAFGIYAIIRGI